MKLKLLCLLGLILYVVSYAKPATTSGSELLIPTSTFHKISADQFTNPDDIQRVRLQFSADDGLIRPLLLGFTPNNAATDGFDYGYDALSPDQYPNDMFWNIDGQNYIIQGVGAFDATKVYPLNVNLTDAGVIRIALTGLENFDSEIDVYVYDSLLQTYTQINFSDFEMVLKSDSYQNRFFIAFSNDNALSITDNPVASTVEVNYLIGSHEVYIASSELTAIKKVHLINTIGQSILTWDTHDFNTMTGNELRLRVGTIPAGTYIIKVETDTSILNKKAIINY